MAQVTTGLRSVLSIPWVYDAFQNLMGARSARRDFVVDLVRPEQGDSILDVGCGTGTILEFLPRTTYFGYDIHAAYIAAATRTHGRRGTFIHRAFDAGELDKLPQFDIVIAISLLHHLDGEEAVELLRAIHAALKPSGRLVTLDPCFSSHQNPIARFIILRDRGRNVRTVDGYHKLAATVFPQVEAALRHRYWIPYTHCGMMCWPHAPSADDVR